MKDLTEDQIQAVVEWMNSWDQLRGTAIPIRFEENFKTLLNLGSVRHEQIEKPPLGLVPKFIRDQQRQGEIMLAINRYMEAGKKPPKDWAIEFASYCA